MTEPEFRDWLDYHASGFTGLGKFLAGLPAVGTEGTPGRSDVLRRWRWCLRDTDLTDAKAASDLLFSGDEPEPKGFDRHPAAVREIARRLTKRKAAPVPTTRIIDGVETFACRDCYDAGLRIVWHPATMQAVKEGRECVPYTCAVRCQCGAGSRYRWMREFNSAVDCEPDVTRLSDQLEDLRNWLAGTVTKRMEKAAWDPNRPIAVDRIGVMPEE